MAARCTLCKHCVHPQLGVGVWRVDLLKEKRPPVCFVLLDGGGVMGSRCCLQGQVGIRWGRDALPSGREQCSYKYAADTASRARSARQTIKGTKGCGDTAGIIARLWPSLVQAGDDAAP